MSSYGTNRSMVAGGMIDSGNLHLRAIYPQPNQGVAADTIASMEGISREALDELAATSQARAAVAIAEGRFDKSLIPVFHEDGSVALATEEYPRPGTTAEKLGSLPASFGAIADYPLDEEGTTFRGMIAQRFPDVEIEHVHHAGNSSGVVDGAAAILFASPDYATSHGLTPRARVVATANMGDDPTLMLNAPVPATRKVLEKAGMTLDQIDLFEINEAFAVVVLAAMRALDLPHERVNVNGGACALGHPIGASGARILVTLLAALRRRGLRRGVATLCIGGGEATAVAVEVLD